MSWHYSQEQEAASWEGNSLDGAPSALLRLIPTPGKSCLPDKPTDAFRPSRSGMTCEPLTENRGAELLMWCLEDSRARTSALPTPANEDWTGSNLDCGERWPESFARFSQDGCLWRTCQASLFGGWTAFCGTWPAWGMMLDGECWAVKMSESRCGVIESGLWRPATSGDSVGRGYHGKLNGLHWAALPGQICQYLGLPIQCPQTGAIAPWVYEVLVGWPEGWSGLSPLATAKYQEWRQWHGGF